MAGNSATRTNPFSAVSSGMSALRTTSTVEALRAAARSGVAPAGEIELLDQGYRFLRGIEHRLRVVHDQPIHRLPETKDELDKLARRSGFPDGAVLLEHVERWQREVRGAYSRLLAHPAQLADRGNTVEN